MSLLQATTIIIILVAFVILAAFQVVQIVHQPILVLNVNQDFFGHLVD